MTTRRKRNGRGGARPGSGPKPKPAEEKRRNRIVVNLTDAELDELMNALGHEQVSTFVRRVLFRSLARRKK